MARLRKKRDTTLDDEPLPVAMGGEETSVVRVLRLSRPDGGTIVVTLPNVVGVEEYFNHVRSWFATQSEELALFEVDDPLARSKRELEAFVHESNAAALAPPAKAELRLEVDEWDFPRENARPPVQGTDYPIVSSISRRAISSLVLSASSDLDVFEATERGLMFVHQDTPAVGQVMLRPLGEAQAAIPTHGLLIEQIEEIRRSVPAWSPLDEDTLEIMLSHAANNSPDEDGFWTLYMDQILDARGLIQKSRSGLAKAGYRADDRSEAIKSIARLDSAWVRVYRPDNPGNAKTEDFVRVFLIAEVRNRSNRLARIRYRPGTWCDLDDARMRSPRKVLEYDPYREAVEKHLARYFLQRADETDEAGMMVRTVEELCVRGGIAIDRSNPKRARTRLTQALDRLMLDGTIVRWTYADDPKQLPGRGYLERWLGFRIRVVLGSHTWKPHDETLSCGFRPKRVKMAEATR
jgi:hypothetical protein